MTRRMGNETIGATGSEHRERRPESLGLVHLPYDGEG